MSIKIEHRNLETRKTLTTSQFRYETLLPLSLKVLRHKERDAHSFYSGLFICPPPLSCDTSPRPPQASESQPSSPEAGLISTNWLFQNLQKSSARFRCVTSFALACSVSHLRLLWHLWVTRSLRASTWTPVLMLHLSNSCTEPKGSHSLTKPKGIKRNPSAIILQYHALCFSGSHFVDFILDRTYMSTTSTGFIAVQGNVLRTNDFLNKCFWPKDGFQAGTTTPGQSGTGSNGNKDFQN